MSFFADSDARRAHHLRVLEQLQRGLAHDAKGPMNAIALNVELLRSTLDDAGPGPARWLDVIQREMRRLDAYLGLVLSQLEAPSGEITRTDLATLAGDVARLVEAPLRQRGARLDSTLEPAPARLDADAVRQVLLWLVVDLLPRTGPETPLRIRTLDEAGRAILELSVPGTAPDPAPGATSTEASAPAREIPLVRKVVEAHDGSFTVIASGTVAPRLRLDFPSIAP